jgi:hypothetical protein
MNEPFGADACKCLIIHSYQKEASGGMEVNAILGGMLAPDAGSNDDEDAEGSSASKQATRECSIVVTAGDATTDAGMEDPSESGAAKRSARQTSVAIGRQVHQTTGLMSDVSEGLVVPPNDGWIHHVLQPVGGGGGNHSTWMTFDAQDGLMEVSLHLQRVETAGLRQRKDRLYGPNDGGTSESTRYGQSIESRVRDHEVYRDHAPDTVMKQKLDNL